MTGAASTSPSRWRRISIYLYQRPNLSLVLLLTLPLLWLAVFYLGALASLLVQSFFKLDGFTGRIVRQFAGILSLASAGVGLLWALVDEESLTWHDHISKTFPTTR